MNALSRKILKILEQSSLGNMSPYILEKQCIDLGFDAKSLSKEQIPQLVKQLEDVLPLFVGKQTSSLLQQIETKVNEEEVIDIDNLIL